ncbi:diacylglycerol/lipid kinase family protein [Schaalia sp. lx-100]|uniref:diacylglycerol/lipid kinase family protein n=1 Tax=Schaalia sp. lx-100 TaxID=2899081 RepID=UPI001E558563|nr:diacylglycerol kinase [Schaalia sp. lx-100]
MSVWVILNPTKIRSVEALRTQVESIAHSCGVTHIHWLMTSQEDPGTGQAIEAAQAGANIVIAAGGDGTVRAVAAGLADTNVRMGILPLGTGNLMARNLGIPLDDVAKAFKITVGAGHRRVDLGWLRMEAQDAPALLPAEGKLVHHAYNMWAGTSRAPAQPEEMPADDEFSFLVISGLGFDGKTMADTDPQLKKRLGWIAYVVAALGALSVPRMKVKLRLHEPCSPKETRASAWENADPHEEAASQGQMYQVNNVGFQEKSATRIRPDKDVDVMARCVFFANCGQLPFVTLAAAASVDDGLIDVAVVDTVAGLVGWANLAGKIFAQGLGIRPVNTAMSLGRIVFRQARGADVSVDQAQIVQVDGDAVGRARRIHVRIQRAAVDIAAPVGNGRF